MPVVSAKASPKPERPARPARKVKPRAAGPAKAAKAGTKASLRDDFRSYARAAILSAAEETFATHGLHDARIEVIADKARVAVGTVYNLVGDRDQLVSEIISTRQTEVVALMRRVIDEQNARPFAELMETFLVAVFSYLREHRHFLRLVVEADRSGKKQALHARGRTLEAIRAAYRDLVEVGIRQRALRPKGRAIYPVLLIGMVREVCFTDVETGATTSPEKNAAQLVEIFLQGAGTR